VAKDKEKGGNLAVRKILLSGWMCSFLVFTAIQFIPYGRNHSNPGVVAEPEWDSFHTRDLFLRACGDCHSYETRWPWYGDIAPASWLVQRDVDQGRAKLNISVWKVSRKNEGARTASKIRKGTMPPRKYAVLHSSARLSVQEKEELISGLTKTFGFLQNVDREKREQKGTIRPRS
jgi:Haem-binding domain